MDESEKLWLSRFQRCVGAAQDWVPRLATPDTVMPGSSLAGDDKGLITDPVRTAAWSGLLSAVDHLALMADLARGELSMRPTALFTPTRAALLGASQAVWVLSGNRPSRRARALAIAEDERSQHRKFLRDYTNDEYAQANFSQGFMADMKRVDDELTAEIRRIRELQKLVHQLGRTPQP